MEGKVDAQSEEKPSVRDLDPMAKVLYEGKMLSQQEAEELDRRRAERQAARQQEAKEEWAQTPEGKLCLELYAKFEEYKKYLHQHPYARYKRHGGKVDFPEHMLFAQALSTAHDCQQKRAEKDCQNLKKAQLAARCQHTYLDGARCRAPRMNGKELCRMHLQMEESKAVKLDLGPMEDADSIQVAIMKLQRTVIEGTLDSRQISHLAHLIQLAAWNVTRTSSGNRELAAIYEAAKIG